MRQSARLTCARLLLLKRHLCAAAVLLLVMLWLGAGQIRIVVGSLTRTACSISGFVAAGLKLQAEKTLSMFFFTGVPQVQGDRS